MLSRIAVAACCALPRLLPRAAVAFPTRHHA
jgi:hypothetical protein